MTWVIPEPMRLPLGWLSKKWLFSLAHWWMMGPPSTKVRQPSPHFLLNVRNIKETPGGTWGWHLLEEQGELSMKLKHNKLCKGKGQGQEIRTNPKWPWIT